MAFDIALDRTFDLNVAVALQVAHDLEIGADDRRNATGGSATIFREHCNPSHPSFFDFPYEDAPIHAAMRTDSSERAGAVPESTKGVPWWSYLRPEQFAHRWNQVRPFYG